MCVGGGGGGMPVRTVASLIKKKNQNKSQNYVLYAQDGDFYRFLCTSFTR